MKVRIVCYEDIDLWILGKFAKKLKEELNSLDFPCEIAKVPDLSADINHHIIYYNYDGQPSTIDTVMITHIDQDWKVDKIKNQLKVAQMGICMSASTVNQLTSLGVPRERLCHVLPAHDQVMRPRPTVIGITSKIHDDGRKRESLLLDLADHISPSEFSFRIMGAGWHSIVTGLQSKGFHVEYYEAFEYQLNKMLVPTFDFYLYLGLDEGAMGFVDALAAGVRTIATPQGYHLEANNGITHPFVTLQELIAVFHAITATRRVLTDSVASWTWREYAIRHIEIWNYLITGNPKRITDSNRKDGIDSIGIQPARDFDLEAISGVSVKLQTAVLDGSLELASLIDATQAMVKDGKPMVAAALYRLWIDASSSDMRYVALYNLGTVLENAGNNTGAQMAYQRALSLNPEFELSRVGLMRFHL